MAKVSSIQKNKNRKRQVANKAESRKKLKDIIYNRELSIEDRISATFKLAQMPRNSAKIRVRNRCELTGRSRGFYRKFSMSRIMLRELGNNGLVPGVTKASW